MASILYLDDPLPAAPPAPAAPARQVEELLARAGHAVHVARSVAEAFQVLAREQIDVIVATERESGTTTGELVALLQREGHDHRVIAIAANPSPDRIVAALRAGAADYLPTPLIPDLLDVAVDRALALSRLARGNAELQREVERVRVERELIAASRAMRELLQSVATVAPTRATVLIQGERGTGKKLLADVVHRSSDRRDRALLIVNCAALPESVVESALFGHERGAFAGALRRVEGALERAHGSTLVLDEVSELREDLQFKLLRFLQEQEFERVGGTAPVRADVRLIATTNHALAQAVDAGRFREDLFYRLAVVPLHVPPLRERPEDLPLLALRLARRVAAEIGGREITAIAPDALALLATQPWPGNVRELQHAVERAIVLSHEPVLRAQHFQLPPAPVPSSITLVAAASASRGELSSAARMGTSSVVLDTLSIDDAERALIQRALEVTGQNRTRAAALLGISVRTLRNKLNKKPES